MHTSFKLQILPLGYLGWIYAGQVELNYVAELKGIV